MIVTEPTLSNPEAQSIADSAAALLFERINSAEVIEQLSDRGGKTLDVVEDENGNRCVVRRYIDTDHEWTAKQQGSSFEEHWDTMHRLFSSETTSVIPSYLFQDDAGTRVVVSEYVPQVETLHSASVDTKVAVASHLASLLQPNERFRPTYAVLQDDMFTIDRSTAGIEKAILLDVDPMLTVTNSRDGDPMTELYMEKLIALFWDNWCANEKEKIAVFRAITKTLMDVVPEEMLFEGIAFSTIHLMSNGVDVRR